MKQKAIIVDLDGTLCNVKHRRHHIENKRWDKFYEELTNDKPNLWCLEIIRRFSLDEIVFVSGRPDNYRAKTIEWLRFFTNHGDCKLLMRKEGDFRKDSVVKEEIYREQIKPLYDVMFCIDDRKQVVDMWRSIGLTCLQCAEGDF